MPEELHPLSGECDLLDNTRTIRAYENTTERPRDSPNQPHLQSRPSPCFNVDFGRLCGGQYRSSHTARLTSARRSADLDLRRRLRARSPARGAGVSTQPADLRSPTASRAVPRLKHGGVSTLAWRATIPVAGEALSEALSRDSPPRLDALNTLFQQAHRSPSRSTSTPTAQSQTPQYRRDAGGFAFGKTRGTH